MSGGGAGGKCRAASIRMPPSSPSPYTKFDPFADEPLSAPSSSTGSHTLKMLRTTKLLSPPPTISIHWLRIGFPKTPLTTHIPPASPTELKWHSTSPNHCIPDRGSSNLGTGSTFLGGSTIPGPAVPILNPSKIVAGILLSRVHAVGKPMRRRLPSLSGPRQHVKSGLSSVVSMEA